METVTDEIGNKVPYQLALLKVHTVNGKQHLTILNQYFNSTVFFAETVDKDGVVEKDEILKQFYEQQRIMAAGDRDLKLTDLTEEDIIAIDHRTDLLIDKVKKHSNDIVFVETIIRELNGTNETIVAHNGKRFDFNNYDVFLHNIGRRLLPNLYYRELDKLTPEQVRERFGDLTDLYDTEVSNEIRKKYKEVIENIKEKN